MIKNVKLSGYHFNMNTNIKVDFQICISIPVTGSSLELWIKSWLFLNNTRIWKWFKAQSSQPNMCCFNYLEKLQKQFQENMALVILNSFVFKVKKISEIHPWYYEFKLPNEEQYNDVGLKGNVAYKYNFWVNTSLFSNLWFAILDGNRQIWHVIKTREDK